MLIQKKFSVDLSFERFIRPVIEPAVRTGCGCDDVLVGVSHD